MSEIVKQEKAKRAKWNTDIVDGLSVEYGFEVWKCSETHFRLFHPKRGSFNYWPSANKGKWDHDNKSFPIPDIEKYLMNNFNPNKAQDKAKSAYDRINELEDVLRRIIRNPSNDGYVLKKIANDALTPKTSNDEPDK